jgi:hypothetical protein
VGQPGESAEAGSDAGRPTSAPSSGEVRAQLGRILGSAQFKGSRRCAGFLQFATYEILQGQPERLKERTIGVEVFGRPPDYDTNGDPIVRSAAGEVRKRLAQYYLEPGHESELRIELPPGSYVPQFHAGPGIPPVEPATRRRMPRRYVAVALASALVVVAAMIALRPRAPGVLDEFWGPTLESQGTVLVCVGQPTTFNLSRRAQVAVERRLDSPDASTGHDDVSRIDMADVIRFRDRYVTLYDAMCLSRVTGFLAQRGKPYRIRGGGSTSLADLREGATVLIGAWDNQWTLTLAGAGQLRFVFATEPTLARDVVLDRQNPERKEWTIPDTWPYWNIDQDYAIVSRLVDPTTGKAVITAAGFTHFGTYAAGEFVTDPVSLGEAVRNAPRGWQHKSLQVVLVTRVIQGEPGRPRVLATHFW